LAPNSPSLLPFLVFLVVCVAIVASAQLLAPQVFSKQVKSVARVGAKKHLGKLLMTQLVRM